MNCTGRPLEIREVEITMERLQRMLPIKAEQARQIADVLEIRDFDKRTVFLKQGAVENHLNMVLKGLVRKFIRKGRNELTLQLATEGHIVHSEISYLKQEPSLVELEAIEATQVVSLSHDHMVYLLDHMPGADRLGKILVCSMLVKKDERLYRQLKMTTRERFLDYINNHPHMLQRVSQKYLASYLNIKPETFSRLKHLIRAKNDAVSNS